MRTVLKIENMKCEGCAGTIRKALRDLPGLNEVTVDPAKETISILHEQLFPLDKAKEKLASLGYPEKGTVSGIDKFTANVHSYISCAIGKFNKE